ncbi:ABC transporter substrate-binding protein [Sphingomonas sp. BGYR3]|uniref:ABC transporter substrate-binding protein n=1 Tax=Sphingomonas sp. BGYR3 TaxID=2975483 RepID=UPI0021A2CB23|nr:ABC transporter substrate-binding protein [Sphingomonas sp. BGYR3]MDG5488269.1 ABC transporter substrate-binding protein [Sphingomonas sp. BGYR3]
MARLSLIPIALIALAAASCGRRPDDIPVVASVIGPTLGTAGQSGNLADEPQRVLAAATGQGLVRLDAAGAIEPGLAARWTVIDDGRSVVFRIGDAERPDGQPMTAEDAAAAIARGRRLPVGQSLLAPVDEVVAMTPQIIEIRLRRPMPDLLLRLAQPEFAVTAGGGSGPMRIEDRARGAIVLAPAYDPARADSASEAEPAPADTIQLRGEPAAIAVARFVQRHSDLVLGGSYRDWPLVERMGAGNANIRIDPAHGLFGLAVTTRKGFLADAANREALAMALDRAAITAAFRPDWPAVDTILPAPMDLGREPTRPAWLTQSLEERQATARARVSIWRSRNGGQKPVIRLALTPDGGGNLLWGRIGPALAAIGLRVERVSPDADADLRVIDRVAPSDQARWFLENACRPCGSVAREAILAARDAADAETHRERLAAAEVALVDDHAYIPIARPLRWSLVALRLRRFQTNPRAWHPLDQLREGK